MLRRYDLRDARVETWWRFWLAVNAHAQRGDADLHDRLAQHHHGALDVFRRLVATAPPTARCTRRRRRAGAGTLTAAGAEEEGERLGLLAHGLALTQLVDPASRATAADRLAAELDRLLGTGRSPDAGAGAGPRRGRRAEPRRGWPVGVTRRRPAPTRFPPWPSAGGRRPAPDRRPAGAIWHGRTPARPSMQVRRPSATPVRTRGPRPRPPSARRELSMTMTEVVEEESAELAEFRQRARAWLEANAEPQAGHVGRRATTPRRRSTSTPPGPSRPSSTTPASPASPGRRRSAARASPRSTRRSGTRRPRTSTCRTAPTRIGLGMVIPTIIEYGTEEQKERYVRKALRGEEIWSQLFSEPGAGSDVASLQTKAVRDGDEWTINGQKVWTTGAQHSDFGAIITRTNPEAPKHRGISMFIVELPASPASPCGR